MTSNQQIHIIIKSSFNNLSRGNIYIYKKKPSSLVIVFIPFNLDPNLSPSKNCLKKKNKVMDLVVASALAGLDRAVFDRVNVKLENSNFASMCVSPVAFRKLSLKVVLYQMRPHSARSDVEYLSYDPKTMCKAVKK